MNTTVVGILAALDEGRQDDAMSLIDDLLLESDPKVAVFAMAHFALLVRQQPNLPIRGLAAVVHAQEGGYQLLPKDDRCLVPMNEILDVIEGRNPDGSDTDYTREILGRFDYRPGSAALAGAFATLMASYQWALEIQALTPIRNLRSGDAIGRAAIDITRAMLNGNQQEVDRLVHTHELNDLVREGPGVRGSEPGDGVTGR